MAGDRRGASRRAAGAGIAALAAALVAALAASCASPKLGLSSPAFQALAAPPHHDEQAERRALEARRAEEARHAPAPLRLVTTLAKKTLGPFSARAGDAGIVVWLAAADAGAGQALVAVPTGADGAPAGAPREIATVPQEATTLVVRPAGASPGWLVAYSSLLDRGEALTLLSVGPDGAARGDPIDLERTSDHVEWADVLPAPGGAVCVWAEETPAGDANILTSAIDARGRPRGMPARVARGIDRWQAVATRDGPALALVTVDRGGGEGAPGKLAWLRLDAQGRPAGDPAPIGSRPTVGGDVDAVPFGDGWLLAWTDRTGEDARVTIAAVDAAGRVQGPSRALGSVGGSWLAGLTSGAQGALLAWDESHAHAHASHALHLALVSPLASPGGGLEAHPVTSIDVASSEEPEIVAAGSGYALLASTRACAAGAASSSCAGAWGPTFVRFDARLDPVQVEPLILDDEDAGRTPIAIAWGLECSGERCTALAATAAAGRGPVRVLSADLAARESPFVEPPRPTPPAGAPRMTSLETIASGQPYEDIAAARLGDATLVAALTPGRGDDALPGAGRAARRGRLGGATITLRTVGPDGRPRGEPATLTSRAIEVGGVAAAPGGGPDDGAAIAWVGRDAGDPQVHVARVDPRGRRRNEVQLTTARGDASCAAIAWAGDGWLVAWVDSRDGNGEVYAAKVDRDLNRVGREERITDAPGDASDVALAAGGGAAWVAWSDPRESPREGLSDIYAAALRPRDARPIGGEVRVLETAPHSRSPRLAALDGGEGALLAWIEDVPTGLDGAGATYVARLDRAAQVVGAPAEIPLAAAGRPTAVALAPPSSAEGAEGRTAIRAIVVRSTAEAVDLDALLLRADGTPAAPPSTLLELEAPGSFDAAAELSGDSLLFTDVGASLADHRVRRAELAWTE